MENNWCVFSIDEQHMCATLALKLPESDEIAPITADYIEDFIKSQGITSGINRSAIEALAEEVRYGQAVEVACGKPAINGQDGYFSFLIPVEDAKAKPIINEDGSVDYYNSLKLAEVKEDELFATYIPATSGEYGHDIFSKLLPPVHGKDLQPLRGKGFKTNESKNEYRALFDGHIIRDENYITIEKMYIVKGDLNIDMGNINFNGDVEITGDVRSGLSIKANGNVFIHGHVGACQIEASKGITIQKGIQGRGKCTIRAGGDVICKFVERCSILADGNVYADSILDSYVTARQQVNVVSKSGIVLGGIITGMTGITVKEAGNESGTTTTLQSGPSKEELLKASELTEQLEKTGKNLALLERQLKNFESIDITKRTPELEKLRMKILRAKVIVAADYKKAREELNTINEHISNARKDASIHVTGLSHAGIKICIGGKYLTVTETFRDVQYRLSNGEIISEGVE